MKSYSITWRHGALALLAATALAACGNRGEVDKPESAQTTNAVPGTGAGNSETGASGGSAATPGQGGAGATPGVSGPGTAGGGQR